MCALTGLPRSNVSFSLCCLGTGPPVASFGMHGATYSGRPIATARSALVRR
jgi:hypothetical protein